MTRSNLDVDWLTTFALLSINNMALSINLCDLTMKREIPRSRCEIIRDLLIRLGVNNPKYKETRNVLFIFKAKGEIYTDSKVKQVVTY